MLAGIAAPVFAAKSRRKRRSISCMPYVKARLRAGDGERCSAKSSWPRGARQLSLMSGGFRRRHRGGLVIASYDVSAAVHEAEDVIVNIIKENAASTGMKYNVRASTISSCATEMPILCRAMKRRLMASCCPGRGILLLAHVYV